MMRLATDRLERATKSLNLSPDQIAAIRPLFQSKYVDMGQVKDVYRASAKSGVSKKNAQNSLKTIHDKYDAQISTILNPEQAKTWKRIQKDWEDDLIVPKS